VPAHGETEYNIVVPTLRDSSGATHAFAGFFMRAATAVPTTYFDSCPDSGYSVDNLAPTQPTAFVGTYGPSSNTLHWRANAERDLFAYRIYRGASGSFVPEEGNLVAQTSDTTISDPAAGSVYYKLSAMDVHGNESAFALVSPVVTGVEPPRLPSELRLGPAVPNPATLGMRIAYELPRDADVRLTVYDLSGRMVRRLVDGPVAAGPQSARWDGDDTRGKVVAPGIYFCRLNVEGRRFTSRVVVAR
jgi:hypothetical protein